MSFKVALDFLPWQLEFDGDVRDDGLLLFVGDGVEVQEVRDDLFLLEDALYVDPHGQNGCDRDGRLSKDASP